MVQTENDNPTGPSIILTGIRQMKKWELAALVIASGLMMAILLPPLIHLAIAVPFGSRAILILPAANLGFSAFERSPSLMLIAILPALVTGLALVVRWDLTTAVAWNRWWLRLTAAPVIGGVVGIAAMPIGLTIFIPPALPFAVYYGVYALWAFGVSAATVLGLPLHLAFSRLGWKTAAHYMAGAVVVAGVTWMILAGDSNPPPHRRWGTVSFLVYFALWIGLLGGWAFWRVALGKEARQGTAKRPALAMLSLMAVILAVEFVPSFLAMREKNKVVESSLPCFQSETVRLKLGDTVYRFPRAMRRQIRSGATVLTDKGSDFCQTADDPPLDEDRSIGLRNFYWDPHGQTFVHRESSRDNGSVQIEIFSSGTLNPWYHDYYNYTLDRIGLSENTIFNLQDRGDYYLHDNLLTYFIYPFGPSGNDDRGMVIECGLAARSIAAACRTYIPFLDDQFLVVSLRRKGNTANPEDWALIITRLKDFLRGFTVPPNGD